MTLNPFYWRLALTQATLPDGPLPMIGLPPPLQYFPKDYNIKSKSSVGGTRRQGNSSYELIWTRLDEFQKQMFDRMSSESKTDYEGVLFATVLWWDSDNPHPRWVDISGYHDVTDFSPNPGILETGEPIYANVTLTFNNVTIVQDPAY